jgi:hypothetical protein
MKDFVPHQIHLTKQQISKLGKGLATNLKHSQMGADKGEYVVMLHPSNARKMLSSYRKSKGMRLKLSPEEVEMTEKEGSGFFKSLKKHTGVGKAQFLSSAKSIGKQVATTGAMVAGEAIGAYTGNPQAGEAIGRALARASEKTIDSVEPSKGKLGVKFDPKKGLKSLKKDAKMYAVEAIDREIDKLPPSQRAVAEKALAGEYPDATSFIMDAGRASVTGRGVLGKRPPKGSPEMKEYMAKLRGLKKGGKVNLKKSFKSLGRDIKKTAESAGKALSSKQALSAYKEIGRHAIEQGIPALTSLASMAVGDPTGMSGSMLGNIGSQYASSAYSDAVGKGIRPRGRPRKGGALASMSKPYKQALKNNFGGLEVASFSDNAPVSSFSVNPKVKPSSSEMTLSPYQNLSSPAMNPFVPKSYIQEGGVSSGYGGRGLYAGGLF